ncbi:MAG TPA: hypothetical protein VGR20_20955 [Acidimicrobiia bacterium]|nr:hypothetical protein [Acidimicrobiia bacterium]
MTWVALALAVVAAALAVALVFVMTALSRTMRSLQSVVDDLNREAVPLLADLQGDARKASAGLDRVGDLVGAAESVTRRVDGASKLAFVTFSNPVVKVLAVGHGVSRVGRRLRGRPAVSARNARNNGKSGH